MRKASERTQDPGPVTNSSQVGTCWASAGSLTESPCGIDDRQHDSQAGSSRWTPVDVNGLSASSIDLGRTLVTIWGQSSRGFKTAGSGAFAELWYKRLPYSNAGDKSWHLPALGGTQRIR